MKLQSATWKWFLETPLAPAWRSRLELCLGVVLSAAAVVALASTVRPDPAKLAVRRAPARATVRSVDPSLYAGAVPLEPTPLQASEFASAVRAGNIVEMNTHYRKGISLSGMLSWAASTGKKPVVAWLLDHGADVHESEDAPHGPVLSADGYPEVVALLLQRGAAEPSLETAALAHAPNAVTRILAKHPNVNARNSAPLQAAATSTNGTMANKRLIVTRLLAAGADPNRDWHAGSALAGAIADCDPDRDEDHQCMTIVRLLLQHGAKVTGDALGAALSLEDSVRAEPLDTLLALPLQKGVTSAALASAFRADPADVKRLVKKGVDWAWRDGEDDAALPVVAATRHGNRDLVRALLDAGAPVDAHYKDGSCALAEAIDGSSSSAEQARIVELLVTRGANVNRRFPDGRTPLFAAAEAGDLRVVNFLLARGARVDDLVLDDRALDIADQHGHQPVARVLHAHGAHRARPYIPGSY